jgi:diacylglycerol kinase (ATP)
MTTLLERSPVDAPAGHALVLANPAAAAVTADLVGAVTERLGAGTTAVRTTGPGHASALAADAVDEVDTIVVLGGDGTVREAAEGIARACGHWPGSVGRRARAALLVLPAGSGNSVARNLWGTREWPEILGLALDPAGSRRCSIDLMHVAETDVGVLLGASSGFLADVLIAARRVRGKTGLDRYWAGAAEVLADMPAYSVRVLVDGVVLHDGPASVAAVGGGRYRANAFQFLPRSVLDDGLLDVCTIGPLAGPAVSEMAALLPEGKHLSRADVGYGRGRVVTIERTDGVPLVAEYDGEVWSDPGTTLTMRVIPGAVPTVLPRPQQPSDEGDQR